jgi:hypothetical protein
MLRSTVIYMHRPKALVRIEWMGSVQPSECLPSTSLQVFNVYVLGCAGIARITPTQTNAGTRNSTFWGQKMRFLQGF